MKNGGYIMGKATNDRTISAWSMLYGCLGALFFSMSMVELLTIIYTSNASISPFFLMVLLLLFVACILLIAARCNNHLQPGKRTRTLIGAVIVGLAAFLGCWFVLPPIAILGAALSMSGTVVFWLSFFDSLPQHERIAVFSAAIVVAGLYMLVPRYSFDWIALVVYGLTTIFSLACAWKLRKLTFCSSVFMSREECIAILKNSESESNFYALFSLGVGLGIVLFAPFLPCPFNMDTNLIFCGVAIACGGIMSAPLLWHSEASYSASMKKAIGPILIAEVFCILCVPTEWQWLSLSLFAMFMTAYAMILLIAMTETTRFEQLSPVWMYGRESGYYILGVLFGILVMGTCAFSPSDALWICAAAAIVISYFQTRVFDNSLYPFIPELAEEKVIGPMVSLSNEEDDRWAMMMDELSREFSLSPRQAEVLGLLAKGRSVRFISEEFVVSTSTVKSHVYMLYRKLGIHSQQELISFVDTRMRGYRTGQLTPGSDSK